MLQCDTVKHYTVQFGFVFAFTAVDIFSREANVLLRSRATADDVRESPQMTAASSCEAASRAALTAGAFGRMQLLQNDGGPECKGEFALRDKLFCDRHRIA